MEKISKNPNPTAPKSKEIPIKTTPFIIDFFPCFSSQFAAQRIAPITEKITPIAKQIKIINAKALLKIFFICSDKSEMPFRKSMDISRKSIFGPCDNTFHQK